VKFYLSATVLTLAWFGVMNALASLGAWAAFATARRRAAVTGRAPGAQLLFAIRMLPVVVAALFAFGVFLPVHWADESRDGTEYFGMLWYAVAGLSAVLVGRAIVSALGALQACRALRLSWPASAAVIDDETMPGMSLAGIFRTTIVVGRPVREALTDDELDVALAHERAHQQSRDNVKRFVMFALPDVFAFTSAARQLDGMWNAAVECEADAVAVDGDPARAANLASALLKVARLTGASAHVPASPLWSTFYQRALLELRVRRLVTGTPIRHQSPLLPATLLVLLTTAVCSAWMTGLPRAVHEMTEFLVSMLP
jgi:Zn-dependent protease with chaperone function